MGCLACLDGDTICSALGLYRLRARTLPFLFFLSKTRSIGVMGLFSFSCFSASCWLASSAARLAVHFSMMFLLLWLTCYVESRC